MTQCEKCGHFNGMFDNLSAEQISEFISTSVRQEARRMLGRHMFVERYYGPMDDLNSLSYGGLTP
jgi:hypothetical protein